MKFNMLLNLKLFLLLGKNKRKFIKVCNVVEYLLPSKHRSTSRIGRSQFLGNGYAAIGTMLMSQDLHVANIVVLHVLSLCGS